MGAKRNRGVKKPVSQPGKGETKRLFFAIDLPQSTIASAERLMETFRISPAAVGWVRAVNLHITLKFLGDVPESNISALCDAVREPVSGVVGFRLTIEGMGMFPNQNRPRVVWFGTGGDTASLSTLESLVTKNIQPLGYPADERPFTAHITIGRVKSQTARGELIRMVHNNQKTFVGEVPVDSLMLYESKLSPGGSIYSVVESFQLRKTAGKD